MPELRILSEYYNKMLYVVDIGLNKIHQFGPEAKADSKLFLIYDGTHYNLGVYRNTQTNQITRTFPMDEENDEKWLEFAKLLKDSGEWIDPNLFALKCSDCGAPL